MRFIQGIAEQLVHGQLPSLIKCYNDDNVVGIQCRRSVASAVRDLFSPLTPKVAPTHAARLPAEPSLAPPGCKTTLPQAGWPDLPLGGGAKRVYRTGRARELPGVP
ncbi:MAG: hypothetical protein ACXVHC_00540 [Frankiaceae bacterium]